MKVYILGLAILSTMTFGNLALTKVDGPADGESTNLEEERDIVKNALKSAFESEIEKYPVLGAFIDSKLDFLFDKVIQSLKKKHSKVDFKTARTWIMSNKQMFMKQGGIFAFLEQEEHKQQEEMSYTNREVSEEPAKAGEPCNPNIPSYSQKGCVPQD